MSVQSLDIISVNLWQILISLANLLIIYLILKKVLFAKVQGVMNTRQSQVTGISMLERWAAIRALMTRSTLPPAR